MVYSIVRHISTKLKQQPCSPLLTLCMIKPHSSKMDGCYSCQCCLESYVLWTPFYKRIGLEIRAASSIETYVRKKAFRQISSVQDIKICICWDVHLDKLHWVKWWLDRLCCVFIEMGRLGRGPKVKIGQINKILWIQLGLYIRKPGGKSLTQKKLILMRGIALEKNGPCSWENEVKISKKRKMVKNLTFWGPILVPKVSFWGF